MADPTKQVFRIVIAGSQEAIFRELTATDRPLGAIFNSHMHTRAASCTRIASRSTTIPSARSPTT